MKCVNGLLWVIIGWCTTVFAQDTIPRRYIVADVRYRLYDSELLQTIDTSLERFYDYYPIFQEVNFFVHLGNLGQPVRSLTFQPRRQIGWDWGISPFRHYFIRSEAVRYYRTPAPYTTLYYVLGLGNKQRLKVTHTQNISRQFNFGFDFNRLLSDGFYQRQVTDYTGGITFAWYQSKNEQYNLLAHAGFNNFKAEQNGGVVIENFFGDEVFRVRKTVPVLLTNAQQRWYDRGLFLMQTWSFGRYMHKVSNTETNDTLPSKKFIRRSATGHITHLQTAHYVYRDEQLFSAAYPNIFLDSLSTGDSLTVNNLQNEVFFFTQVGKHRHHTFDIRARHNLLRLYPLVSEESITDTAVSLNYYVWNDTSLQDLKGRAKWSWQTGRFYFYAYVAYGLYGFSKGDYHATLSLSKTFFKNDTIASGQQGEKKDSHLHRLSMGYLQHTATWIQQYHFSNHFQWKNQFRKNKIAYVTLLNDFKKWNTRLQASCNLLDDYIYFDSLAQPQQAEETIFVFSIMLHKNFRWKMFCLDNQLMYQRVVGLRVIRVPEWWGRHAFYYDNIVFKNTLHLQTGLEMRWHTPYFADAYMPAIAQFYLQDNILIAPYPVIDFFLCCRVKRARLFFRLDHLNNLLFNTGYYYVPHYPMPDFSIQGGISWMFFD